METEDLDPRVRETFYLSFIAIMYLAAVVALLYVFSGSQDNMVLFALALLPLFFIFVVIWRYGLRMRLPGVEVDYYPVEKVMKPPHVVSEEVNGDEAENVMEREETDFLNILDRDGLFQGIFTKADAHKARVDGRIRDKVKYLMTGRDRVVHAFEQESLKSVMRKIGQTKHSRLPVLDKNNRLMGVVDAVDIHDLLSQLL